MDKVQKNTFTDYNALSSEPFRLHADCYQGVCKYTCTCNLEPEDCVTRFITSACMKNKMLLCRKLTAVAEHVCPFACVISETTERTSVKFGIVVYTNRFR
jgi:hypothetical protein